MEEKKPFKISLYTFLLLLAIIAIIAMAYYIYTEKTNYNKEIENLDTTIANMQNTIEDFQGKFNSISNTINSNATPENSNTENSNNKVSNNEVDKIAIDLFENGSKKIRETEYSDYPEYDSVKPLTQKNIAGITYEKRNLLFSEVKKEYSKIFTGEALEKVLSKRFAEIDGYLYVSYGGATGWNVTNIKLSRISESNNKIEYLVTYNDVEIDDSISEEYSCKMTVDLIDGNYRISETSYFNLNIN